MVVSLEFRDRLIMILAHFSPYDCVPSKKSLIFWSLQLGELLSELRDRLIEVNRGPSSLQQAPPGICKISPREVLFR